MKIKNSSSEMKVCNHFFYIYIEFRIFILKYVWICEEFWGLFLCVKKKPCEFFVRSEMKVCHQLQISAGPGVDKKIQTFLVSFTELNLLFLDRIIKITIIFKLNILISTVISNKNSFADLRIFLASD